MEHYSLLAQNYTVREEMLGGRKHLVVPVVMMTAGVHAGSHGPLLHLPEDLGRFPGAWDGIPVAIQHPTDEDGTPISCNQPAVLDAQVVGRVFNTHMDGPKLRAEAWLDPEALARVAPEALGHIREGKPMDVSVGVFTEDDLQAGEWNGERYIGQARNHRPDHLALLPGATGACSWADGCGIRAHQKGGKDLENIQTNAISYSGTETTSWSRPNLSDFGKGNNWASLSSKDKVNIANHFLIGDDSAANYGELMFPVVNPGTGKLNESALRAVIGGRGAQANITAAQRISARRQAYRLLNSEFDAQLQVPTVLEETLKDFSRRGLGFSTNQPGQMSYDEISETIQDQLDQMDTMSKIHYLTETWPDHFIYKVIPREGGGPGSGQDEQYMSQKYTIKDDGTISFDGDPIPVSREVSYIPDQGGVQTMATADPKYPVPKAGESHNAFMTRCMKDASIASISGTGKMGQCAAQWSAGPTAHQKGGDMSKPCCEEKVQMLIEAGLYGEPDRERLLAMGEADINVLVASMEKVTDLTTQVSTLGEQVKTLKTETEGLKANAAQEGTAAKELQTLKESLGDQGKLMAILPPETRGVIQHGLGLYRQERERKIEHIIAHTVPGVYTKEILGAMDDQALDALSRAIKVPVDYTLGGGRVPNVNLDAYAEEANFPPEVEQG